MKKYFFSIVGLGFASFFLIGAAGAASDQYFANSIEADLFEIVCAGDRMVQEHSTIGTTDCSVHRVSTTYGRQIMASHLSRQDIPDE